MSDPGDQHEVPTDDEATPAEPVAATDVSKPEDQEEEQPSAGAAAQTEVSETVDCSTAQSTAAEHAASVQHQDKEVPAAESAAAVVAEEASQSGAAKAAPLEQSKSPASPTEILTADPRTESVVTELVAGPGVSSCSLTDAANAVAIESGAQGKVHIAAAATAAATGTALNGGAQAAAVAAAEVSFAPPADEYEAGKATVSMSAQAETQAEAPLTAIAAAQAALDESIAATASAAAVDAANDQATAETAENEPDLARISAMTASAGHQRLETALEKAEAEIEELADRKAVLGEHLRSVQAELGFTQARVASTAKAADGEAHMHALQQREAARLASDIKSLKKERGTLAERLVNLQNQIYRATEKMDQFKVLMNWNQEELEQWALTRAQKEEDSDAVEQYRAQDATKIKELKLAVERMSETVAGHRVALDKEVTDTQAAQVQLDNAADAFARLHKERQELMQQWEDANTQMRRNDAAIQAATQLFADKKAALRAQQTRLDASAKQLDDELVQNKEREAQLEALDRELEHARAAQGDEKEKLRAVQEQVELLKGGVRRAGGEHARAAAANSALAKDLDAKKLRLDGVRAALSGNKRKLESDYVHLDSLAAREAELAALRDAEAKRLTEVERKIKELEKLQFSRGQELFKARAKEKDLVSEISGGQAQSRNLVGRIGQLDDQVIRQQELLYSVEFQLQQMERKVARAKGERSDEEAAALNARIAALTQQLEGVNEQHSMLLGQVKKAEDDLSKALLSHQRLSKEQAKVRSSMTALTLETDTVSRGVKAAAAESQRRRVDLDVQKVEVQRLRAALNSTADEVFSLENRKFQLQQSLHERRHEIDVHRQTLEAELKLMRDDCHRVTLELQQRRLRVSRLQSKFEVLSKKHTSVYDDGAEPRSQAYYVIKSAQEREELRKTGDTLDGDNERLQREVAALEQTLDQMIECNSAYSKSFKPVNETRAVAERTKLRTQLDKAYDRLKGKRAEERALAGDVLQAEARRAQLEDEEACVATAVSRKAAHHSEAATALREQDEELDRARGAYEHLVADARTAPLVERVKAAMVQQSSRAMLDELEQLARDMPSLGLLEELRASGVSDVAWETMPGTASMEQPLAATMEREASFAQGVAVASR